MEATPEQVQEALIERFAQAGGPFEQFDLLLRLAAELDELADAEKTPDALVDGCQSQVWLHLSWQGPAAGQRFNLRADSDTLMVRGVIRILQLMFNGQDAQAVARCPLRFVDETELSSIFDAKRQAGVAAIVGRAKEFAREALAG